MEGELTQLVDNYGLWGVILFLIPMVSLAAYDGMRRLFKSMSRHSDADVAQQQMSTTLVPDLYAQMIELQGKVINMAQQNGDLRETNAEMRTAFKASEEKQAVQQRIDDERFIRLESQVRQHEKTIAELQAERETLIEQRDRLQRENNRYEGMIETLQDRVAKLEAEIEAYRTTQVKASTQEVPPLPVEPDAVAPPTDSTITDEQTTTATDSTITDEKDKAA